MGVTNLIGLFKDYRKEVTWKDLANLTIAIDVSNEVYRSILAMKSIKTLTDSDGNTTSHINTMLCNALNYKKYNITPIYVFDNVMYPEKRQTLVNRQTKKEKALEKIQTIKDENETDILIFDEDNNKIQVQDNDANMNMNNNNEAIDKLQKQAFTPEKHVYEDVKMLIDFMGDKYVQCNFVYEAEQYCAYLTKNNHADIVMSSDADTFLFGAKKILRKEVTETKTGRKVSKMFIYDLDEILQKENLTQSDLIDIGISLGTDFCQGTPKIGIKTAVKKIKSDKASLSALFSNEQKRAKEIFLSNLEFCNPVVGNKDVAKLNDWLKSKNFKKEVKDF